MKCYTLLRDNLESGPFTLEEIIALDLKPMDLVWKDGSGQSWRYLDEIEELKAYVNEPKSSTETFSNPFLKTDRPRISIIFPPQYKQQNPAPPTADFHAQEIDLEPGLETRYTQSLDDIKEKYVHHLQSSKNNSQQKNLKSLLNLAALFAGLVIGAVMIKNIVESFEKNITDTDATAAVASSVTVLPEENNSAEADASYHNALTTETVVLDTTVRAPEKKISPAKKENVKKLVALSANKYRVGVFGGINNLNLTINNKSSHVLDKVNIEVSYLKQNGDVIKKENYNMRAIAPKSVKVLNVPASNRGVKIKYRITDIKSHPYKAAMLDA